MIEGMIGFIALMVMGVGIILWLSLRQHGRAYAWGRIAARAKANYEAALLRERRDKELKQQIIKEIENEEGNNTSTKAEADWQVYESACRSGAIQRTHAGTR
jgi:hypothetical protein